MKNKEKYAKEIVEIACSGDCIAVEISTCRPVPCNSIRCANCLFNEGCISHTKDECIKKWAESEYIEKPVVSKKDRAFLEYLGEAYKYIARDKNKSLFAWKCEPVKTFSEGEWTNMLRAFLGLNEYSIEFPMVKWEDDEPWLIDDLKKLEVVDSYE